MREGGVHDASPLSRAGERRLIEDLADSPLRGRPIPRRLRNFRPDVANYVVSLGGPRPYMERLREIEVLVEQHEERLAAAHDELAMECGGDREAFARRWRALAERWRFDEVNELIERHNRWYPVESRLRMDPRTGDYALVNGRSYRRPRLGARWVLERFPSRAA